MMKRDELKGCPEIHLAHTQGFCAGVAAALEVVDIAIEIYGTPLYVRHEIVHNTTVVHDYASKGVIFVESLEEVPDDSTVIFSAHGVGPAVYEEAKRRRLNTVDATCPLVTKVHFEAKKFSKDRVHTILIGHRGHQELIGTSGWVSPDLLSIVETVEDVDQLDLDPSKPIGYLTQTTLSISDANKIIRRIEERYPTVKHAAKKDICYATENRQQAVITLANKCDVVIICGSPNSSNSNRLRETAEEQGVPSYIIDTCDEFEVGIIKGKKRVGISSGASVPKSIVDDLVNTIREFYPEATVHQEESIEKDISFNLPRNLQKALSEHRQHAQVPADVVA